MDRSPSLQTYRARWILPVTSPPIEGGYLTFSDGRLVDVSTSTDEASVQDLGDVALLPGLVNAHTHLEFSDLTEPLGKASHRFADWIRAVLAHRQAASESDAAGQIAAIQQGLDESHQFGVRTIGEITTSPFSHQQQIDTKSDGVSFLELICMSDDRIAAQLESARQFLDRRAGPCRDWSVGLSPHAPYTAHPELVRRAVELAKQAPCPIAMHLAETREELELLSAHSGPLRELLEERQFWNPVAFPRNTRPLDYLKILAAAPRCLVIHGNYLQRDEIELLAIHGRSMSLVYCPRTHSYFSHEAYPLAELLNAGVRLALGTDSRASNPDLSMWSELKFAVAKHPEVHPADLLAMATVEGGASLGTTKQRTGVDDIRNWLVASVVVDQLKDPYGCLTDESSSIAWLRS
jgi:cytosine/adenosine deaminase-related metal-dependent hydrolase